MKSGSGLAFELASTTDEGILKIDKMLKEL